MDPYLKDRFGNELVPIWSPKGLNWLCTLKGSPSDVPANLLNYYADPPNLLFPKPESAVLSDLDFTTKASIYNPKEHWLGWTPPAILPSATESPMDGTDDDPIDFLFDNEDIGVKPITYDAYNEDSDGPQNVPVTKLAG
ncbi:hypothetical protein B0H17DRAFT_1127659 [Mycena rosella]|uniref:Uncharacterized protein n=1 Tax=Mycena rosella TaxID=1033263 RepID=A0AAD7GQZ1_MYCRO|nr:hypothetical protein B0H17DRAFT_1127659 [Mycena rosella]